MRRPRFTKGQGEFPLADTPTVSLFNRFMRQTAHVEGATIALVTLPRMFPASYTRKALTNMNVLRQQMLDAKRITLAPDFLRLVVDYSHHATPEQLHTLYTWGRMPFDAVWIEWPRNVDDSEAEDESMTGVLLRTGSAINSHVDYASMVSGVHCMMVYTVPDSPNMVVSPPRGFVFQQGMLPFSDAQHAQVANRSNYGKNITADMGMARIRDILAEFMFGGNPERAMVPLRGRMMPSSGHMGGVAFADMLTDMSQWTDLRRKPQYKTAMSQLDNANKLIRDVMPIVPVVLGMLSLAPIRHLVDKQPAPKVNRPEDWRWKHDSEVVTLVRPVTTAEVVQHIAGHPDPSRHSPMLHDVMGHWRVYHGTPSCNHIWHEEATGEGTDTHLGRPHRTDHVRYRCTRCQGLRTWVTSHTRGDATRGVRSKDYAITTQSPDSDG